MTPEEVRAVAFGDVSGELYQGLTSEEYDADLADVLAAEDDDRDLWAAEQAAAAESMTPADEYAYWHGGDDG